MKNTKVVFMGTPDFSVPILEMLIEETNVVMVVTQPDKEVGRKKVLTKSPVKMVAESHGITVFQPSKIRNDYAAIREVEPHLIVTCAYGQIIPQELLDIPKIGSINVHASLLPKYRGSAPIQWALINGEDVTGVTLMYMDAGMDTGDMIKSSEYKIKETDDVGILHDELSKLGAMILHDNLDSIINKEASRIKQNDEEATYAPRIKREDELILFNKKTKDIYNRIRALSPWPLSYFILDGLEIKIEKVSYKLKNNTRPGVITEVSKNTLGIDTIDGIIYLEKIKPFGKKIMNINEYLNGVDKDKLLGKVVN